MKKLLFGVLFIINIVYAEPTEENMGTNWIDTSLLSHKGCMQKAEVAIKKSINPSKKFVQNDAIVLGNDGEYTILIQCIPEKKIAFIVIKSFKTAEKLMAKVISNFRN